MQSKNKPQPSKAEHDHIERIKALPCAVCHEPGPSDAHEPELGLWWLSIPLCRSCHMDNFNGWHGQRRMWAVMKQTEMTALNATIERLLK